MKVAVALIAVFAVAFFVAQTAAITCRDEQGNQVDWWVIFKAPVESSNSDPNVQSGFGYAYADANAQALRLTNKRLDTNTNGALGSTLGQLYGASTTSTAWFMYNDQPPTGSASDIYGHTKGDVAFNSQGGFWLIHSVPRFPHTDSYSFPDNEKDYGQSFLCITLGVDQFDTVGEAFLLNRPYIYSSNLPSSLANRAPSMRLVADKKWITSPASSNTSTIRSAGGVSFMVFSRNAKWENNLYSALVGPTFSSSLLVESWMNGAISNKMPSFCAGQNGLQYSTMNVRQVSLSPSVAWPETKDHSKWAVTTGGSKKIFCIGDTNRQYSQAKRGGGTVCTSNPNMWQSITSLIATSDNC